MKVRYRSISIRGKRCILISDIHGNLALFQRLLAKVQYDASKDVLLLLGDLIEKGPASLETLRFVMELAKQNNVYIVKGNCDEIPCEIYKQKNLQGLKQYQMHIPWKRQTLLYEMSHMFPQEDLQNWERYIKRLLSQYAKEFSFLKSLDHVLESEDALFVHAGLEMEIPPYARDAHTIMKNDAFAKQDICFAKILYCGHTPVVNYDISYFNSNPHVDRLKNIVSIDGGCGIKPDGQLNACILEDGCHSWTYVDELELRIVKKAYHPLDRESHIITFFDREVEVLEEYEDVCKCQQLQADYPLMIPTSFLYQEGKHIYSHDFTDYTISVEPMDQVGLILCWREYAYVKKEGIHGWIPSECIA